MPTSTFLLTISILIAVHNVAHVFCGDQCFNIDQIQELGYYPCSPAASTSNCCQPGWLCLSNGLCEPNNNVHRNPVTWTGYCTDPLWDNTTACPKICQNNVTGTYSSGGQERSFDLKSEERLTVLYQLLRMPTIVYHRAEMATSAVFKTKMPPPVAVHHLSCFFWE